MLLEVTNAQHVGEHSVRLTFNDGRVGIADLRALAPQPPATRFAQFADAAFTRSFVLAHGTLRWPGDLDIAAEYLYFLAFSHEASLAPLFREWGYTDEARADAAA